MDLVEAKDFMNGQQLTEDDYFVVVAPDVKTCLYFLQAFKNLIYIILLYENIIHLIYYDD